MNIRVKAKLLNELLEEAFWINSNGNVHYNFREDVPISKELAEKLKPLMRQLTCNNYERP